MLNFEIFDFDLTLTSEINSFNSSKLSISSKFSFTKSINSL